MARVVPPLLLLLAACSSPRALDEAPMDLSPEEGAAVMERVEQGIEQGSFVSAWNQAVDVGAGRETFERIALAALEERDAAAEEMLRAVRDKWGGLTPEGRQRVDRLSAEALRDGTVQRAVQIEILAADDAPAFSGAWRLYREVPQNRAPSVLEAIRDARKEHAEREAEKAAGPGDGG
jgi:hypothetical protein